MFVNLLDAHLHEHTTQVMPMHVRILLLSLDKAAARSGYSRSSLSSPTRLCRENCVRSSTQIALSQACLDQGPFQLFGDWLQFPSAALGCHAKPSVRYLADAGKVLQALKQAAQARCVMQSNKCDLEEHHAPQMACTYNFLHHQTSCFHCNYPNQ